MEPENQPQPASAPTVTVVTCPSCASRYNPATHELIEDTGLPRQISDLRSELATIRSANESLTAELAKANDKVTELSAALAAVPPPMPAPKKKDFVVGVRN